MRKKDTTLVPTETLRVVLDIMASSLDFGSGFWDQEDTNAAREIAVLLGICPNAVTPDNVAKGYPACSHTEREGPDGWLVHHTEWRPGR